MSQDSLDIDIANLAQKIHGEVVTSQDPEYRKAIARWAVNAERKAKLVVFVKNNDDVVLSIKFAKTHALSLAIRGGGHNVSGASSAENGLVVDLSKYLNTATVDVEKKLAFVGGGAIWETVDKEAIKYGLATVGGTVNHTGVGGLTLGGGYGWLTSSHGLAIDNLKQATIVTADGSILTASDTENQDLFFGIRGGGCNFGIATEFVLKLHEQRRTVYAGPIIFSAGVLEKLLHAVDLWWKSAAAKEGLFFVTTMSPQNGMPVIMCFVFYNGTESEGRERFKSIIDIGPIADKSGELPYEVVNSLKNEIMKHGQGVYLKGTAQIKMNSVAASNVFDKVMEVNKSGNLKASVIYEFFPLPAIDGLASADMAFPRNTASSILLAFIWKAEDGDQTDLARSHAREILAILEEGQSYMNKYQSIGYSNYSHEGINEKNGKGSPGEEAKILFQDKYARMQVVKKKYDPENIFNKWFPVTPAPE